ncbi:MAG: hypothetical protein WCK16_00300 [Candidatus Moraniibacteriota bacterium]
MLSGIIAGLKSLSGFGVEVAADAAVIKGIPAIWGWLKKSRETLSPEAKEKLDKFLLSPINSDGRTREDEMVFSVSLFTLPGVPQWIKELFIKKHDELLNPDLSGKSPDEIKKLKEWERRAKGFIFLIATDPTVKEIDESKRFVFAKKIWYGIFSEVEKLPSDDARLEKFERDILLWGKNYQEKMSKEELLEKTSAFFKEADSVIASGIDLISGKINSQWDEIETQRVARKNLPWKGNATEKIWGWLMDC